MTTTQNLLSIESLLCLCSFCRLIEATHTGHCLHLHISSILSTAQCSLHTNYCTIHSTHCTLDTAHWTLYSVMHKTHLPLHSHISHSILHTLHCIHIAHFTKYTGGHCFTLKRDVIVEFDLLFVRRSQVAFTGRSFISTSEVRASMNNTMTGGQQ